MRMISPYILKKKYSFVKQIIIDEGYEKEISWQSNINFEDLTEECFLKQIAWVILSSGMKEQIIRKIFPEIAKSFFNWKSIKKIVENKESCYNNAIQIFKNKRKILSIIKSAEKINRINFLEFKKSIKKDPIDILISFPFIGPVTAYHLAKNIGIDVAKPDRHLVKIAKLEGYKDVQRFCSDISEISGDSIPVVDIVFWRYANLHRDYLDTLSNINFDTIQSLGANYV
jgi:hypothetical protein